MFFEAANRGKRSLALDLTKPEGREVLYRLVETADVFITNLRAGARAKMGIEPETLMKINPRLVYARGSGYGIRGDMADHGGFDQPSSWRSEEHTSELQSLMRTSYAVFCLKKNKKHPILQHTNHTPYVKQ